jgi:hypothetical protein
VIKVREQAEVEVREHKVSWNTHLQAACAKLDQPVFLPLFLATAIYLFVVIAWSIRPLWYDELFTYCAAKTATLERFISLLAHLDLNPPLQAGLTIASFKLFGESDFAARIPSMIAFWVASFCLFQFVSYRLGRFYGLAAMLAFWSTDFLRYASEARPYALMVAAFGIALVHWQRIAAGDRSRWRFVAIALGVGGVLMSHVFGPVLLLALGLAEIARSIERRQIDWGMWIAFFSPAPLLLVYLPMLRAYSGYATLYPPEFQASLFRAFGFYGEILADGGAALLAALAVAVLVGQGGARVTAVGHEIALCAGLLAAPLLVNVLLMRHQGAFWPRYCIRAGLGIGFLFANVLAKATRNNRGAGAVAAVTLLAGIVVVRIVHPAMTPETRSTNPLSLDKLDPGLPLVAASGVTFLEMNKREDNALLSHVFYLTDRDSAEQFTHATIFQVFGSLDNWFPVRAHVERYRDFVAVSPHFLVLGTLDFPEDWLIPKLLADKARLRFLGELRRGYKDVTVFDVTFPDASERSPR